MKIKRGMAVPEIGKIILAVLLLVMLTWAIIVLIKGEGFSALKFIKDLFRFGKP